MIEITFYPAFVKSYQKKTKYNPTLAKNFMEKIDIFKENPFDNRLKTHKLSGNLKELYSFSIDYYHRIILSFYETDKVIFEYFGSHDDVY